MEGEPVVVLEVTDDEINEERILKNTTAETNRAHPLLFRNLTNPIHQCEMKLVGQLVARLAILQMANEVFQNSGKRYILDGRQTMTSALPGRGFQKKRSFAFVRAAVAKSEKRCYSIKEPAQTARF